MENSHKAGVKKFEESLDNLEESMRKMFDDMVYVHLDMMIKISHIKKVLEKDLDKGYHMLSIVDDILSADEGSDEAILRDKLLARIEEYEEEHYPIGNSFSGEAP